ncbi:hypothetical protein QR98_0072740 [Sarcoptes scabiei]|uniref:MD-2-related lipid-recognition domain-containing protein n=1 Tax=Sarcoptes scabiei TaxID=52283 RepID=A0A132AE79_SARSC|nr:hypothetical protein QR98_0072740 [Sarcoptes scabiei]
MSFNEQSLRTLVYFDDCGNNEIQSIDIEPCPSLPCHFDQGSRANLTIVFRPTRAADYIRIYATLRTGGLFGGYQREIYDADPEICETSSKPKWGKIKCPIVPGRYYTFQIAREFPVSTTWNMFRYSKIRLIDRFGQEIACADWYLQFNRFFQSQTNSDAKIIPNN